MGFVVTRMVDVSFMGYHQGHMMSHDTHRLPAQEAGGGAR